jgi:hypothetical protein
MSDKFLRCFCYGLNPGDTVLAEVEGQAVLFTFETPQIDVPVAPSVDPSPVPAPVTPE